MPQYLERVEAGRSPVEHSIPLGEDDRRTQYMTSTIGDGKALDRADYEQVFGNALEDDFGDPLGRLRAGGLIESKDGLLNLSEVGRLVHDRVTFNFYPQRVLNWLDRRRPAGGMS
jgi:coproporphyrinogen III oxidase-like Fe-S oxidoreductase